MRSTSAGREDSHTPRSDESTLRERHSGEERLLRRILDTLPATPRPPAGDGVKAPCLTLGPGDDAAAFHWPAGGTLLLTTDASEEGVHFDRRLHPLRAIGRRAVAAAVSDVAAMGGQPVGTLISLVAPPREEKAAAAIAEAAARRAAELGAPLVGGNITSGERLGLHVVVAGATAPGAPLLRRTGAMPGDGLFVSGELGGAALGLALLRGRGTSETPFAPHEERLVARQLDPTPRLAAGLALAGVARAAMDISDGLALDLHRLVEASRAGALIEESRLPLAGDGSVGLEAALFGGEDYELLFTGPEEPVRSAAAAAGIVVFLVGRITEAGEGVRLRRRDGLTELLPPRGWDSWAGGADNPG